MTGPEAQSRLTVSQFAGMDLFLRETDPRCHQAIENSGQIVIFCNRAPVRWLTPMPMPQGAHSTDDRFSAIGAAETVRVA